AAPVALQDGQTRALGALVCVLLLSSTASAQDPPPPPPPPPVTEPAAVPVDQQPEEIDRGEADLPFVPAEPDFTLVSLPTTLRLAAGRWGFRVSHRFTRPLGQGDLGDLASDFFGFDSSALVGLELRYGIWPGTQLAVLRTSDRTIQFLGQTSLIQQGEDGLLGLDALAAIQGFDNFTEDYTGILGGIVSRRFGERGAAYVQPLFVLEPQPDSATAGDSAFMLGLGARLLLGASTYIVGEYVPRLSGPDAGDDHVSFAIERRKGGHSFQINVSNNFATTLGQVARSYGSSGDWHIGF
ncbi:MAG: DUF5777 family beta-barrel protein, partial [Vicinamibacterales bacterium]